MAVKLRLMRMGKKKQPTYRVVAADSRSPRNGRFIEIVGIYDPRPDPFVVRIDNDKAVDWLRKGAQPTDSVRKLLEISGALEAIQRRAPSGDARPPGKPATSRPRAPSDRHRPLGRGAHGRAVLEHLVGSLVEDREPVRIDESQGRSLPRLTVRVGPTDMGRVIGKRGRVAQAIRTVVRGRRRPRRHRRRGRVRGLTPGRRG